MLYLGLELNRDIMDPAEVKYRPMPNSKKKEFDKKLNELRTETLLKNAIVISSQEAVQRSRTNHTLIVYSDEEEDEQHSDGDQSTSCSEGLDCAPTNLPESVDVEAETDSDPEEDNRTADADALDGADVFKDVTIEADSFEETAALEEEQKAEKEQKVGRVKKLKKRYIGTMILFPKCYYNLCFDIAGDPQMTTRLAMGTP